VVHSESWVQRWHVPLTHASPPQSVGVLQVGFVPVGLHLPVEVLQLLPEPHWLSLVHWVHWPLLVLHT
jgi:hypothetical protein